MKLEKKGKLTFLGKNYQSFKCGNCDLGVFMMLFQLRHKSETSSEPLNSVLF